MASPFPNPRRITVGHSPNTTGNHAEPGVDVLVDNLESKFLYGGNSMKRASIATHTSVPTSNNEPYVLPYHRALTQVDGVLIS